MKKGLLLSLCYLNLITANLNAKKVVGLEEDINITKISSKTDSIENHDVTFALELGAKTDFWNPGLSKEQDGGEILKYDTEGLYLGSAILKTKIYGTDVFSLEKFGTLKSSNIQSKLLNAYENDKKDDSSFTGYRASIQLIKILNYLFETDFLDGLEYSYTTKNFIGSATLTKDSIYWFGSNPGSINTDYLEYEKNKVISFQTKFVNNEIIYRIKNPFGAEENSDSSSTRLILGGYYKKWKKPTYIGHYFNNKPILYDAKYSSKGVVLGFDSDSKIFNLGIKAYFGIDNEFDLTNEHSAKDDFNNGLGIKEFNVFLTKTFPKIYSGDYFDIDFIIKADASFTEIINGKVLRQKDDPEPETKDAELLYGISLALDFTF